MLLLTTQFHDSCECLSLIGAQKYFSAQSEASIYQAAFVILLYEGVSRQTRLFAVPVWLVQEGFQNLSH